MMLCGGGDEELLLLIIMLVVFVCQHILAILLHYSVNNYYV